MTTKQPNTANKMPGRSLTPEGQIRRKRKTQGIKREIRQEWNDTERAYREGKARNLGVFGGRLNWPPLRVMTGEETAIYTAKNKRYLCFI